jgi:hypothetical protein
MNSESGETSALATSSSYSFCNNRSNMRSKWLLLRFKQLNSKPRVSTSKLSTERRISKWPTFNEKHDMSMSSLDYKASSNLSFSNSRQERDRSRSFKTRVKRT